MSEILFSVRNFDNFIYIMNDYNQKFLISTLHVRNSYVNNNKVRNLETNCFPIITEKTTNLYYLTLDPFDIYITLLNY